MAHVIHFHSVSCFVFLIELHKNVTRKFKFKITLEFLHIYFSFNGSTFQTEPSTTFAHYLTTSLGNYRDSPFITGSRDNASGQVIDALKTEILNYESSTWVQADDFPFSNSQQYV